MNYRLSFFDGIALLECGRTSSTFAWVKEDDSAYVSFPRGRVQARIEHLQSFSASLPMQIKTLREERKWDRRLYTTCKIGEGEIYFRGKPSKFIAQFVRVLNRIWPLMQLAKTVLDQLKSCPLAASVSIEVCVPKQEINGVSVKHFLESRREAAVKIDPQTARILRSSVYRMTVRNPQM